MARKKSEFDEVEELDKAYTKITGYQPKYQKPQQRRAKNWFPVCAVLAVLVTVAGILWFVAGYGTLLDGMLKMGNVSIGGISMEGMTKRDAKDALAQLNREVYSKSLVVQVLEETLELSPVYTELQPDMDGAVDAAWRKGAKGEFDLIPYLRLNTEAIRTAVDSLSSKYNTDFIQTVTNITGTRPSLEPGAASGNNGLILSITLGSPQYGLDTDALYDQVLAAYNSGSSVIQAQCTQLQPEMPNLDLIYEENYVAPVDATMDPKSFEVFPESYGYHFDLEAAKAQLAAAQYGQTLEIPFVKISPQVTSAELSSKLFCDILGSARTPYKGKDTNNRNTNLAIACEAINGLVLLPGETFSYNDTLGERTAEAGYKEAPSYVGGLTVDTLGGGICQISSTLYYSTLFADLEILERHNHGYVSDYIDKGMDATVTWDGADFRFQNNTNYPIRIEAWRSDGYVNVRIIGTDEKDYYIQMSYKVLESTPYDTIYKEYPRDNPDGYRDNQEIVTPYKGYIVQTYKEKYSKATDELIEKEKWTYDVYKKRDRVICKIVDTPSTDATE